MTSRTKILTVMIVDIVGYTKLSGELGRERFDELNDDFDRISLPLFQKYAGQVVKKVGDSFIVVFDSATDSLHCGIELQNRFWEYRESRAGLPIKIKIALNTGEVIIRDHDIYGETVNVVSRVEKLTKPGHIYFTQPVFLAMNKNEIPYEYLGRRRVKGVNHPLKIFRVKELYEERRKFGLDLSGAAWKLISFVFWLILLGAMGFAAYKVLVMTGYWDLIIRGFGDFVKDLGF